MAHNSIYFYGNKISEYGLKNGYVDYRTLAKSFNAVLNNDIINKTYDFGYWDIISGGVDNSKEIEEIREQIEELEELITMDTSEEYDNEINKQIEELEEKIEELEEEQEPDEIFQWYIVDDNGARILEEAQEIIYYNEELDMYLWGVTHYGTSWDYVLTNIKIEVENIED